MGKSFSLRKKQSGKNQGTQPEVVERKAAIRVTLQTWSLLCSLAADAVLAGGTSVKPAQVLPRGIFLGGIDISLLRRRSFLGPER